MKQGLIAVVFGLMLVVGTGKAEAGVITNIFSGGITAVSTVAKTTLKGVHEGLHAVQNIAGGVMVATHAVLDLLEIPFTDR